MGPEETSRPCNKCGALKPLSEYRVCNRHADGHRLGCLTCEREGHKLHQRKLRADDPVGQWVKIACWAASVRARKRGVPFSLTVEDIRVKVVHVCPVLGIPLDYTARGKKGCRPNSPSVDRIVPALGYVPGNIIVVSHRANTIKNDSSPDELQAVADFYRQLATRVC